MYFKHVTIALVLLSISLLNNAMEIPPHLKKQARKLHDMCQKETGVDEALIKQGSTGSLPNDRTLQCYLHCLFDKVGLMDSNQVMHLEYLLEILPPETHSVLQSLSDKCGTKPGADACETAFLTVNCYFAEEPEALQNFLNFIFL